MLEWEEKENDYEIQILELSEFKIRKVAEERDERIQVS